MMLLFLVDSKKMMALGAPYVRGADSAATWRRIQWPGHGKTYQVKQLRRLPDLLVHLA